MLKVNNSQEQEYDLVIIIGPDNPGDKYFKDLRNKLVGLYQGQLEKKKILIIGEGTEAITPEFITDKLKGVTAKNAIIASHGNAERIGKEEYGEYIKQPWINLLSKITSGCVWVTGCRSGTVKKPEGGADTIISLSSRKNPTFMEHTTTIVELLVRHCANQDSKDLLEYLVYQPETTTINSVNSNYKFTAPKFDDSYKKLNNLTEYIKGCLQERRKSFKELLKLNTQTTNDTEEEVVDTEVQQFIYRCLNQFSFRGEKKNLDKIALILKDEIGIKAINEPDETGWTALHFAAENGHLDIVTTLIEKVADINKANNQEMTALHLAAANGHTKTVETLIENKATNDATDNQVCTALHFAAANGHKEIVKKLVENGANKDATNNQGWTALHLAAANGHLDIVTTLIENGANKDATDNKGWTALHFAAPNNPEMVAVLSPNPNPSPSLLDRLLRCLKTRSGVSNPRVSPIRLDSVAPTSSTTPSR